MLMLGQFNYGKRGILDVTTLDCSPLRLCVARWSRLASRYSKPKECRDLFRWRLGTI